MIIIIIIINNNNISKGCWNVQGLYKINMIPTELEKHKADIVVLAETKKDQRQQLFENWLHRPKL